MQYTNHHMNLMQFFEGYVRNYRRLNLHGGHNKSMFTQREIDYFAKLGELLGFDCFVEDSKFDKGKNRSRPMDLSWWKWDQRIDKENYHYLSLHLERESLWKKDEGTIEKLFSETEEGYVPHHVIAIQFVESKERIPYLNRLVREKNEQQQSNVLMIYRFLDDENGLENVWAYHIQPNNVECVRKAVCMKDQMDYWLMCFEEEKVEVYS
ncbi:hypothetical protein FIU87_03680 [Bacillus sp. THAF10]|uniref:hypothetical protein n=1 Tax=Bacillus sp. THAF10 TaxID=2587848 RepID=UPI0012AAA0DD|nr:hypothetical protein [Bacillus sp. THAF10]QFT87744.1 hypothetical protein FIU87_03680 [Bacillus sp. THAF10]